MLLMSCGSVDDWLKYGFGANYILAEALRWHVNLMKIKSSPVLPQRKKQSDTFKKKMG